MRTKGMDLGVASIARLALLGLGLGVTTALRFARLFPNNDPILAVMLPYAKRSRLAAFGFPVLAMGLFDLLTQRVGVWTIVTAGTYGLIGVGLSFVYVRRTAHGRAVGAGTYFLSGIAGVLAFDFITGPVMSSGLFRMSFTQALLGQIPFTIKHLVSVSLYALIVSPLLDLSLGWLDRVERRLRTRFVVTHAQLGQTRS